MLKKIDGQNISLTYVPGDELKKYVKKQNNFLWITSLWDHPEIEAAVGVKYDETKLSEVISALQCMKAENQTASVNAHPEFKETQFEVVPEVIGTQINTEKFTEEIKKSLDGFQPELDLEESMQIQSNLASTIAMAFDECPSSVADRDYMEKSVARTTRWLVRCKERNGTFECTSGYDQ